MGTRGICGFKVDGEYKLTYNHFDSYPESLGKDVVEFVRNVVKQDRLIELIEKVRAVELVDESDTAPEELVEKYREFGNDRVGSQDAKEWYCLLRELQGVAGLEAILDKGVTHMIDSKEFMKHSLFCEYAYIIDLDDGVLEFYKGFQKEPQAENPFGTEVVDEYYPCAKVGEIPLDDITNYWEEFYTSENDEDE